MSHRTKERPGGWKRRQSRYRFFLCILLLCSLIGLGSLSVQQLREEIPEHLRVQNLEELSLDFGWLVTEQIYPESERVSLNAFSSQEYEIQCSLLGVIPLRTVSVELAEHQNVYTGGMPVDRKSVV